MPELPEVETIRIGLSRLIVGKRISSVQYDWFKSFPNTEADVQEFLTGATVTTVGRRAKVLVIDLDTDYSLVIHLKMTGQLVYVEQKLSVTSSDTTEELRFGAGHPSDSLVGKLPDKSTRVIFEFSDDSRLYFNDQRKFGWVRLLPTIEVPNIDFFRKVGPEPLAADFLSEDFRERIRRRPSSAIKAVIMDQTVIAGVGNIYADESLWAAKIYPSTRAGTLSAQKLNKLYDKLRSILELSIAKGGSTDKNYVNAEGKKGNYLSFANVFRREGKPCPRCEALIVKTRVAGRGTHFCPRCQKEERK